MQTTNSSARELLAKLVAQHPDVATSKIIGNVVDPRLVLQDFMPADQSLEWEIGASHWRSMGVRPFIRNEVPFLINNDGLLSELAATLLFSNCVESAGADRAVNVVEYGAGSGLFARFFLDAFRELCAQQGSPYYDQLTYFVTDASPQTVMDWQQRGLFADHGSHVIPAVCNATRIEQIATTDGQPVVLPGVRAAFCNYVLDVLPCAIVRQGITSIEELHIRTYLTADTTLLAEYAQLTPKEILALLMSDDPADRARLERMMVLFDYEARFLPLVRSIPYIGEAIAWGGNAERVVVNYAALALIEKTAALLESNGFILVNDYGATEKDEQAAHGVSQRFGATSAIGINFPLLGHFAEKRGLHVLTPPSDSSRSIHARLITHRTLAATTQMFMARFAADALNAFDVPAVQARSAISNGGHTEALDRYREAVELQPRNWRLLGEIAEFLLFEIKDASSALELAKRAVELNSTLSAWVWNVLGDALWVLEKHAEAHTAYLEARRIDPDDPRTLLNLSYTLLQKTDMAGALEVIARGLASDKTGTYRERLLAKQQHVLASISATTGREHERALLRISRLQPAPAKQGV